MDFLRNALIVTLLFAVSGCNTVGPRTIPGARLNYNVAIARSADEQLLLNLVRLKYRDTPFFLEVTSVSTQYVMSYGVSAGGSLVDPSDRDAGASVGFTEKPTVQYSPLQGGKFVTQILSPISLETLALLARSGWSLERVLRLCVQDLGPLENAPTASGPTPDIAPEYRAFREVAAVIRRLQLQRALDLGIAAEGNQHKLVMRLPGDSRNEADLLKLFTLLNLSAPGTVLVFSEGFDAGTTGDLRIRTRSLMGVMYYLSQNVQVPERHQSEGRVTRTVTDTGEPFDWSEVLGDLFTVHSRWTEPMDANVKVHYRGTWFYIDDRDLATKTTFGMLGQLFFLQAGEIKSLAPALTLSLGN